MEELLAGLANDGALVQQGDGSVSKAPAVRVPTSFAESVRLRFDALPAAARDILTAAALLGRRIEPDILAAVAGAEPCAVAEALRLAEARMLVETHDSAFRFRHALTRDTLLADLPRHEHASRADAALGRLQAASDGLVCERPEVVADLAEAAGRHDVAVRHLLEVGARALRQGALTSAESVQRRAHLLAKGGQWELRTTEALVETLGLAGRADDTFPLGEVLLAMFDSSPEASDPDASRRRRVHLALGRAAVAGTDWPLATAHLEAARRHDSREEASAELDALRAVVALGEGRLDDARRLAADAVRAAEGAMVDDLLCEALLVYGRCARIRDHAAAERAFDRARRVAHAAGLAHREARALAELGSVHAYRGGTQRLLEARRLAGACGAPETEAVAENHLAVAAWHRADDEAILTHAAALLGLARRYHLGLLVPAALVHEACAYAMRGDAAAVEARMAEAAPQIADDASQQVSAYAHVRGVCALANDDLAAAAPEFAAAAAVVRRERPTAVPPLASLAVLLDALDGADPEPEADELRALTAVDALLGAVLAAAGAVALGRAGERAAAASAMDRALRDMELNPLVHAMVIRLVAPRALAEGWGEPVRWLEAAAATFEARCLSRPAAACRDALRSRSGRAGSASGFTARERDVLALVAQGLPNRAIAERLFLSARTVEKHVERLLAKTGCANRAQLVGHALNRERIT